MFARRLFNAICCKGGLCAAPLCQTPAPGGYLNPKPHLNWAHLAACCHQALMRCYTSVLFLYVNLKRVLVVGEASVRGDY